MYIRIRSLLPIPALPLPRPADLDPIPAPPRPAQQIKSPFPVPPRPVKKKLPRPSLVYMSKSDQLYKSYGRKGDFVSFLSQVFRTCDMKNVLASYSKFVS